MRRVEHCGSTLGTTVGAFKGLLWLLGEVGCGLKSERSERLAKAKGQASVSGACLPCARAVVSGASFVGAETLARTSTGGHANLFAGRACGCGVSAPHLIAVALLLSKGLACYLQAKLLLSNFNGNLIHF